jgi:hypothetical protein
MSFPGLMCDERSADVFDRARFVTVEINADHFLVVADYFARTVPSSGLCVDTDDADFCTDLDVQASLNVIISQYDIGRRRSGLFLRSRGGRCCWRRWLGSRADRRLSRWNIHGSTTGRQNQN